MQTKPLKTSCAEVINALIDLGYSKTIVNAHKQAYSRLQEFAVGRNVAVFSQELAETFLKECFSYSYGMRINDFPYSTGIAVNAMERLRQLTVCGCIPQKASPQTMNEWAMDDFGLISGYLSHKEKCGLAPRTIEITKHRLQAFYQFIRTSGERTIRTVSKETLTRYWRSMQGDSQRYCYDKIYHLGSFMKYLHLNGHLPCDMSGLLPKVHVLGNKRIAARWDRDSVMKILGCIDRANPVGKRDYAAFVMVAELGLRASDINGLRLDCLNWDTNQIEFTQCKTGKPNTLPITPGVGWALIDYIRHGRPKSNEPYVFLTGSVPHVKMPPTAFVRALTKYRRKCGLFVGRPEVAPGMHSFRHALAHRLFEKDVPLDLIAEVMGHTHVSSTSPYLRIDIEGMRPCALAIEEVAKYARDEI